MKTLIILAIILGILAAYFVFNIEKSISVKGTDNAMSAGTDIAKIFLNQIKTMMPKVVDKTLQSNIVEQIKSKAGEITNDISDKLIDLIKKNNYNFEYIKKVVSLEQQRLKKLNEIGELAAYFFKIPQYQPELLVWRDMLFKDIAISLNLSFKTLSLIDNVDWNYENLEKYLLKETKRAKNKDTGRLLWPLRVALTGLEKSPSPFEILDILGKKESLERIKTAIKKLI